MLKLCSKKNYPAGYQLEMKAGPAVECYDKIVTSKDLGVRTGTMTKICEQRSTVSLLWKLCESLVEEYENYHYNSVSTPHSQ